MWTSQLFSKPDKFSVQVNAPLLFIFPVYLADSLSLSDFISPSDPHLSEVCVDSNLHVASPSATKKILISA